MDVILYLEAATLEIYEYIRSLSSDENDFVGISILSTEFVNDDFVGSSLRPLRTLLFDDLWTLVFGLTQSNETFKTDESFVLEVSIIEHPHGAGGLEKVTRNPLKKRSMIKIINEKDSYCLERALVVGVAHMALKKTSPLIRRRLGRA